MCKYDWHNMKDYFRAFRRYCKVKEIDCILYTTGAVIIAVSGLIASCPV